MAPSVIVIGASGNFGPSIVAQLISHKASFNRIAILSAPEKKDKFSKYEKDGVEIVLGSFADASSYKGFDAVISLAGNAIMIDQVKMIDAAVAAGVRHFIPSEFGMDIGQAAFLKERYFQDKQVTRRHLEATAAAVPGFTYTYVLIGAFAETLALSPGFGLNKQDKIFTYFGNPDDVYSLSSMTEYTVEQILLPFDKGQSERNLRVPNEDWKMRDAVALLGKVRGVTYTPVIKPVEKTREEQESFRREGNVTMELYSSLWAVLGSKLCTVPRPWDNDRFAWKPLTLEEMFRSFEASGATSGLPAEH